MKPLVRFFGTSAVAIAIPVLAIGVLVTMLVVWETGTAHEQAMEGVWTCSIHPQVRLPQSGPCPICHMPLIPVSKLAAEQARVKYGAGLQTEKVSYRDLFKEIRTVGKLNFNEQRVAYITARVDGRVDRIYADVAGIRIKQNDHLVDIYSPALNIAQAELISAL